MMASLFTIFDGNVFFGGGGVGGLLVAGVGILAVQLWLPEGQTNLSYLVVKNFSDKEFKPLMSTKKMKLLLPAFCSCLLFFSSVNLFSLIPDVPGLNAQLKSSMISMLIWLSYFLYCYLNYWENFMSHMIPFNTPAVLLHFMVLVESVSNLIRPITLAIRMSANLTSGHLILSLLSASLPSMGVSLVLMGGLCVMLLLELAVSVIQGYIFSVLLFLYYQDMSK